MFPGFPDGFDVGWWREEVTTPPIWTQPGATTTSGLPTVSVGAFAYPPIVGQQVSGAGIPAGSVVSAVGALSLTLSANATANGTVTLSMGCEPVSLAQAKKWARIQYTIDDTDLMPALIQGAREYAEGPRLKRAIMLQARTVYLMGFPWGGGYFNRFVRSQGPSPWWLPSAQGIIRMPYPPFQGLISITYVDQASGNLDTIPITSQYIVQSNTPATPGAIMPQYGAVWPIPRPVIDAVRINWMCGYGAFPFQVPLSLQNGLCGMIAATYVNRQEWLQTREMAINEAIERSFNVESWGIYS